MSVQGVTALIIAITGLAAAIPGLVHIFRVNRRAKP